MRRLGIAALTVSLYLVGLVQIADGQGLDSAVLSGMKARSIGPAGMSGRVTSIDVVLSDTDIIYAGTASGGLWRTTNGGTTWTPIFDDQRAASIGAVVVNQSNPDIVWVGTGEGNPRNSMTGGTGVYKSIDQGRTWQHMGLSDSRAIHRIILHPTDPQRAWIGVQGPAWGETPERGVFKTTDGGQTWKKVLYVDERTGVADLIVDPDNPDKMIAAMWQFRRWPWFFKSGGSGSGLYVTYDGGDTWKRRSSEDGLPEGDLGRIGLAFAPSDPDVVYAFVEAKKNGFYRSKDGGDKWSLVSSKDIGARPFYYADIYVDPENENRIWSIHGEISRSEDGGETFKSFIKYTGEGLHPDHHAWWIHPSDGEFIIDGNDGGLNISRDRGNTWTFIESLPLAQFYHIAVDMDQPYNVYGGMQDNGAWKGPSSIWRHGGIRNSYWEELTFGDGFDVVPDPNDSRFGWSMSQGGHLLRYDAETGANVFVRPTHPDQPVLRFNWNAGIAVDPFDPATIYYGSQFLHRSVDRGDTWEVISPDLTTNDPTKQRQLDSGGLTYDVTDAENFTTITAISPSNLQEGVIWVGTDDGNVQVTLDAGQTWSNVRPNITGVPDTTWVPQIRASTYDPGTAFVVFDDHRRNNWKPYLMQTRDFGKSWTSVNGLSDIDGYILSFLQDPEVPELMFIGSELGLYVTVDGGAHWTKWKAGYPTVSTMDLAIQEREGDLVIGTFGRGAYILDDIEPLRSLARDGLDQLSEPVHVFEPPTAYQVTFKRASGTRFAGDFIFSGQNRPQGALITYALGGNTEPSSEDAAGDSTVKADKVTLDIFDSGGELVNSIKGPAEKGLNRVTWNLRRHASRLPSAAKPSPDTLLPSGLLVQPGIYKVRLTYKGDSDSTSVSVHPDPRFSTSPSEFEQRQSAGRRYEELVTIATNAADRLRKSEKRIATIRELLGDRKDDASVELRRRCDSLVDSLKVLKAIFMDYDKVQGIRSDPMTVSGRLTELQNYVSSPVPPGQGEQRAYEYAAEQTGYGLKRVNAFFEGPWAALRLMVEDAQLSLFEDHAPLKLQE